MGPGGIRRPGRLARAALLSLPALALLGSGCGGDKEFTAAGFIKAMNAHGATLKLGPVLATNPDGIAVHAVEFTATAPSATGEGAGTEDANGAATLLIFDGDGDAEDEFARCEAGPALTCYRAANAVLRIADLQPSDRARITTAIEGVAGAD